MALSLTSRDRHLSSSSGNRGLPRRTCRLLRLALAGSVALLGCQTQVLAETRNAETGTKGAQIYCFMRGNGNTHQVSWDAAYAVIKRQGDRLFRTSPQHAAVMITEAVVANPQEFPDCGSYLGDLFRQPDVSTTTTTRSTTGATRGDRYGS